MSDFKPIKHSYGEEEGESHFHIDGIRVTGIIDVKTNIGIIRCFVEGTTFIPIEDDHITINGKEGQLVSKVEDPKILERYLAWEDEKKKQKKRDEVDAKIKKLKNLRGKL